MATYIISKYGKDNFGNFKALASLRTFRYLVSRNIHARTMFSFEWPLAKFHDTYIRRGPMGVDSQVRVGKLCVKFEDDQFGTICGAYQDVLFGKYPEYASYVKTPVSQLGHGCNVKVALTDFKRTAFEGELLVGLATMADFEGLVDRYNAISASVDAVTDPRSPSVMHLFQVVHEIFRKLRLNAYDIPGVFQQALPYATDTEIAAVMRGRLKRSVHDEMGIDADTVEFLQRKYGEGVLSEDRTRLEFSTPNPFYYIGSVVYDLAPLPRKEREESSDESDDEFVDSIDDSALGSSVGTVDQAPTPTSAGNEDVAAAVAVMMKFMGSNRTEAKKLQKLAPSERVIAEYGSVPGQELFNKMSPSERRDVIKLLRGKGVMSPEEWLMRGMQHIQSLSHGDYKDVIVMKLVAGFTFKAAASMKYDFSGCTPTIRYD